jgi:hypothetical protein
VARAGIERATFRFSDGSDYGTSPFALVGRDTLDQQAVVEPVVPRLAADNRRTDSTPTEEPNTVYQPRERQWEFTERG